MNLTLFDLDGTLLPVDSNKAFGAWLVQRGWIDGTQWTRRNDEFLHAHDSGNLDLHAYIDFATAAWRDRPREEVDEALAAFMRDVLLPAIPASSRALVDRHRAAGDLLALVTATNEVLTAPIARALGIDHLIAVRLARDSHGRVTGLVDGVPSFHAGKVDRVNAWLAARSQGLDDFERVTFYGDSVNDVPLLERVSHPVATNPGPALRALAASRGWPVVDLFGPPPQ